MKVKVREGEKMKIITGKKQEVTNKKSESNAGERREYTRW